MSNNRMAVWLPMLAGACALTGCMTATEDMRESANAARFQGRWQIVAINGALVSGPNYQLGFDEGRLTGQAGCNRFSGPHRIEANGLVAGRIDATYMACPGARMLHEGAVLNILRQPMRVVWSGAADLVLSNEAGTIRLRRMP